MKRFAVEMRCRVTIFVEAESMQEAYEACEDDEGARVLEEHAAEAGQSEEWEYRGVYDAWPHHRSHAPSLRVVNGKLEVTP